MVIFSCSLSESPPRATRAKINDYTQTSLHQPDLPANCRQTTGLEAAGGGVRCIAGRGSGNVSASIASARGQICSEMPPESLHPEPAG